MKRRFLMLLSLMLALMIPFAAFAEAEPAEAVDAALPEETVSGTALLDGLMLTATVEPANELAVKAPASGELDPFTLRAGDVLAAGDTLFTLAPQTLYAEADGTVAAVYAAAGDTADGAMNRYGAVMHIDYTDRYQFTGSVSSSRNTVENRDLHVGTPVFFRSADKEESADGVITQVSGVSFTAQVIGGDLDFTERVTVYRDAEYMESGRLSEGRLTAVAPYAVAASGTILTMNVQPGDAIKAGDPLLTFVPDTLAPAMRTPEAATVVTADADWLVLSVTAQQGGSVQKGQPLATVCALGDYQLVAQAEEGDIGRFTEGAVMQVIFEELDLEPLEATVTAVGALGAAGDVSTYPVYLTFDVPAGVLPGMHATVEGIAAE
ncbi:MAG: HlyD family efflux transporter periplasmic adaptor subunit [Clostridia bacterium]|nr:HlyD family efflux transporter periplasmic adaptor subunit [Clostridia bacterium]